MRYSEDKNLALSVPRQSGRRRTVMVDGESYAANPEAGWKGALAAYLAQKDVGSEQSRNTYRKELICFFRWLDKTGRPLDGITKTDILEYKDYLEEVRHCTSQTVCGYITALRGFYQWAEAARLYPDVTRGVKTRRDAEHIRMHLNRQKTHELLEWAKARGPRDYAMINLMLRCGLRTVEVHRADIADVSFIEGHRVLFIQGKGRKDKKRWVALRNAAWEPLKDYIDTRKGENAGAPLFVGEGRGSKGRRLAARTVQHICKTGLRAIGLDSHMYTAHSLRHTTGVRIISNGGSVTDVQEVLGHASVDTSRIYLKSAAAELRLTNPAERFLDDMD